MDSHTTSPPEPLETPQDKINDVEHQDRIDVPSLEIPLLAQHEVLKDTASITSPSTAASSISIPALEVDSVVRQSIGSW
jgi:hypothetical protein